MSSRIPPSPVSRGGALAGRVVLTIAAAIVGPCSTVHSSNGFDLSDPLIPGDEIHVGVDRRDAIPALDTPSFLSASDAVKRFGTRARVLVVRHKRQIKAYPIAVLNWHEIVNDTLAGLPIVVTYCPLCGTGIVFLSTVDGAILRFGVSGLLYQSDVLLYDRGTDSLWSQVLAKCVTGKYKGKSLEVVASTLEPLGDVVARDTNVQVLSAETGHTRDYDRDPYARYQTRADLMFPVDLQDRQVAAKAWCILLKSEKETRIVPISHLDPKQRAVQIRLGKVSVTLEYDPLTSTINCPSPPSGVTCIVGYYFALRAFHHDAKLQPKSKPPAEGQTK